METKKISLTPNLLRDDSTASALRAIDGIKDRGSSLELDKADRTREEIKEWAQEHDLPIVNDRVQFPDFRLEYEHPDGRRDVENVEVTTAHYRGAHASGKVAAGFTRFKGAAGRVGGSGRSGSSSPFDPRGAEEFLG